MTRSNWLDSLRNRLSAPSAKRRRRRPQTDTKSRIVSNPFSSGVFAAVSEGLEQRRLLTALITFTGNTLAINVDAAAETVTVSEDGADNLSITSNNAGGTTADAGAQTLGFAAATAMGAANIGSIAAGGDVRLIAITGTDGTQIIDLQGGTFTATTIGAGNNIGTVNFSTAASTFDDVSGNGGSNVNITTQGALSLGQAINVNGTGNLSLTAGTGNLTDSGAVTVGGTASFTTTAADASITLSSLAATGAVSVSTNGTAGDASVVNASALALQGTVNGVLSATATAGGITDSGTLSVTGDVTLNDVNTDGITLGTLQADSDVIITAGGNTAITNDAVLNLEGAVTGTLAATATTGGITDSGNLSATGNVTLNDVALAGVTLDTLQADANVIVTAAGNTAITNDAVLNLEGAVTGTLAATATTGGITDSGNLSATGNVTLNDVALAGVTLDTLQADANVIVTAAGNTAITNDAVLNLEGAVTGTLAATATTGGITDSGNLSATGNVTLNDVALAGVTLDTLQADANVIVTAAGNTAITNDAVLNLEGAVTGTLAATATTGGITDSGNLSATGNVTLNDVALAGVTLDTLQADANVIVTAAGNTAITNDAVLNLEGAVTGTLAATATTGGITDSGNLSATGNVTLNDVALAGVTLDTLQADANVIVTAAGNTAITNDAVLNLEGAVTGTLAATATTGGITDSGNLSATGNVTLNDVALAGVTLDTLQADANVIVTAAGNTAITNDAVLNLEGAVTGTLAATATTGGITDSGNLSATGNVTLNDVALAGVTLDTLQADANVIVTAAGNTAITNDAVLNLEGAVTGTLAATATTGGITDSGNLSATGNVTLNDVALAGVTLDTLQADANVIVTAAGNTAITNDAVLNLEGAVTGTLAATATTGGITDSGNLSATGNVTLNDVALAGVTLDTLQADANVIVTAAGNTAITNDAVLNLEGAVTGTLAATATTGGITDSGNLSATGNVTLNDVALAGVTLDTLQADANVIVTAAGNTAITNDAVLNLEGAVTGTLAATATTGGITDSGNLSATGNVTLNDVALAGVTLDTLQADANVIVTAAGNTAITNDAVLNLEGAVTGTLAATATTGGITDSGNLSATGNVTLNDVALAGVTLDTLQADANVIVTAAGNTAITNDAVLNLEGAVTGTLAATATTGGITDSGNLSATGNVTLNDVALAGVTLDTLQADANVIVTAAGNTAITNDAVLNLEGAVTGTLAATATTGGITDSGNLSATGNVTLNDVALAGVTLDTLQADANVIVTAAGNTAITNDAVLNLEGAVTGTLAATATTGGITDSGNLSATGNVTLNDVALAGVTLDTLQADANVIVTAAGNTAITNDAVLNLEGAVTGTLAATATTGGITDSGNLSATGNVTLNDVALAGVTLDTLQADANVIVTAAGNTAITNDAVLNLEGAVTGTLAATATTGGITDSGNLSATGNVTLNDVALAGVTLDTLQADANVIVTAAGNTAITNDAVLNLEGAVTGTLAATATTGGITDSGNLSATGNVTLNDVALAGVTLDTLQADANVIVTAAGNTAITNDAVLNLEGAVTGTLAATATTGGITDSGNLSATGNVTLNDVALAGVTLDTLQADANVIVTAAGNTAITNDAVLNLEGAVTGTLAATATTGGITDSGNLSATGNVTLNDVALAGVTLDTLQADANVIVTAAGNTAITNDAVLNLEGAVTGTLAATATTGGITDSGNLSATGNVTLNDVALAGVTLDTLQADANVIVTAAGNTAITNDAVLNLEGAVTGTLAATATTGGITDSGNLSATGNVTLNDVALAGVTLDTLQADANVIVTAAGNTAITNDTVLNLEGAVTGTLAATATTGGITDSGNLSATGNVTLNDVALAGVTLDTLQADANVIVTAAGNTAITNDAVLNLEGAVTGTLAATATTGGITDSGNLSATGNVTLNDVALAGVTLDTLQADANVIVTAAGNTAITNDTVLNLEGAVTGTLAATATTGGITDSGNLSATGNVTLNDVALAGVTLDTLQADANVIVTAAGNTAITNDAVLNLEGAVTGTLAATATTGGITDSGNLSATGNVTLNDVALAGVTLDTLQADANVIVTAAGNTAITNDAVLNLEGAVTGTLAATATTGGITDSGNLSATGNVTLNDVALAGVTLDTLQADANVIVTAAGNTAITNDAVLNLEGAVTGTLAATATTGGITDSGNLSATGNVTLNDVALAGVTLDTLQADANVIVTAAGNTAITNDAVLNLEGAVTGTLAATATTGGITDSGNLSATGNVTLNDVALAGVTLDTLQADANVIVTAAGNTAITNDAVLNLEGAVTGTLAATATTGGITDSGNLSATGNVTLNDVALAGVTLDTLQADANVIVTAAGNTAITNDAVLNLEGAVTGTLAATATTGGITDSGNLSATGNVTLNDVATAGITLGTLQADSDVIITAGGNTAITNDTVLNVEGTVTGTLDATATTGNLTDSGTLTVGGTSSLTVQNTQDIILDEANNDFQGAVTVVSARDATLNDVNAIELAASTISRNSDVDAGTDVTVSGKQTVTGTVIYDAGGDIDIDADVDPTTVQMDADDDITINAAVVATTSIDLNAGLDGSGGVDITATGSVTTSGAASTINVDTGAMSGDVVVDGAVRAGADLTAGGTVAINSVAGGISGSSSVTATNIDFDSANGVDATATPAIGTSTDAANTRFQIATANVDIDVTGSAIVDVDNTNTTVDPTTINSMTSAGGDIRFRHNDMTTGSGLEVSGVVSSGDGTTNGGNAEIRAEGDSLTINGTVSGTPGTVSTAIGSGGMVDAFAVSLLSGSTITPGQGNITLIGVGDLIVETDIISAGDIDLAAPRDVIIRATVQSTGGSVALTADETLAGAPDDGTGGVLIEGNGLVDAATSVTLTGADLFNDGAGNDTEESVRIDVDDMSTATAQVSAGGAITIESEATLSPATADIIINGVVNSTGVSTTSVDAAQNTLLGNDVTGTNNVDFNDNVIVTADVTVSGANVDFDGTVDDDGQAATSNVIVNGSGTTTFTGAVGGTALTSLTTDAAGSTVINGGSVTTTAAQDYGDDVTLGANTNLTGTTVSFDDTVDAMTAATQSLTVTGNAVFGDGANDFVGSVNRLSSLTVTGTTLFNTTGDSANNATVLTDGNQDYQGNVTLAADVVLASANSGTINVGGAATTVNGDGVAARNLTINTMGLTQLDGGNVGNVNELNNLITDDPAAAAAQLGGITELSGNFNTELNQTFNDAVELTGNVIMTSSMTGDLTFNSTLDADTTAASRTLALNTAGITNFNGVVGGEADAGGGELESLTTDATGTTNIDTTAITTNGSTMTFNDPVVIMVSTTLTENDAAGAITFNDTVVSENGESNDLNLDTPTGANTNINGNVGGTPGNGDEIGNLTTDAAGMTVINVANAANFSVSTSADQTYNDQVLATNATFNAVNITAIDATNDFIGTTSVNATGNATITDANAFDFGMSTIDGNLVLIATGDVTDSGDVVVTGMTTITTMGDVILDNAGTDLGDTTVIADDLTIQNDAGGVNLQNITLTGNLLVESADAITNDAAVTISVAGTSTLITMNDAGADITIDTLNFTSGAITARTLDSGGVAGDTVVDANIRIIELTDTLTIDRIQTGGTTGNVFLETADAIVDNGDTQIDISAANVALRARSGIGSTNSLETAVSTLAALNDVTGSIEIDNTVGGTLTVGTVDNLSGVENFGGDNANDFITLSNASPVVISTNMTANATITVTATEGTADDNITVNNGATVLTSSGDVNLNAGDGFSVDQGTSIIAQGSVNLTGDIGDNDASETATLSGNFEALTGAVNVDFSASNDGDDNNTIDASLALGDGMTITGGSGNDTITATGQADLVNSGAGDDCIIGGPGADTLNAEAGADEFVWNNGDGPDELDGGADADLFSFNGAAGANDNLSIAAAGDDANFDYDLTRTVPSAFTIQVVNVESQVINADTGGADGNDTISVADLSGTNNSTGPLANITINGEGGNDTVDGSAADAGLALTINGDAGDDSLTGSAQVDTINGGADADTIDGNAGDDILNGDAGDDLIVWNNGDGSDDINAGTGTDRQIVNLDTAADVVTVSDDGGQLEVARSTAGAFTLEIDGLEELELNTAAGADDVTVSDLSGLTTALSDFDVSLGDDADVFDASADASTSASVLGEAGDDTITGGDAVDTISGGADNDSITGSGGSDVLNGDDGDDTFVWLNGDASDTVEGGTGNDTQDFDFVGTTDDLSISANAGRLEVTRTLTGPFTVTSGGVENLDIDAGDNNDSIVVNDLQSLSTPLASATFALGDGNDTFDASADASTALSVDGGTGTDAIVGGGAVDTISGGTGDDTITGGGGSDVLNGGDDNDLFIWNNGDASDTVEGDGGTNDRQVVNLDIADDNVIVRENTDRLEVERTTAGPFTLDIGTLEELEINTAVGADTVTVNDLAALTTALTDFDVSLGAGADRFDASADNSSQATATSASVLGEAGNDTIIGGSNEDTISGGDGNDSIEGGQSNDTLTGDADDDTFVWRNTDASDRVEGGTGDDTLIFDIQGTTDTLTVSDNGGRLDVARTNTGPFIVSSDGIENLDIDANGNDDSVTVSDLSNLDQALTSAIYRLGGGDDTYDASADASATAASVLGETGNDTIDGGAAADTISGGADNDSITGNGGDDLLQGDDGDDTFVWDNTDASDDIFGGTGTDAAILNGNVNGVDALTIDPSTSGSFDYELSRGGDFTLEITEVESQTINADGGTANANDDSVTVSEISSTNGSLTNLTINGDDGADTVNVTNSALNVTVSGGAGGDTVDATNSSMGLTINGDADNDTIAGSGGADIINGGAGDDAIVGNPGDDTISGGADNDTITWNQGDNDDTIDGDAGNDTVVVNGSAVDDSLTVGPSAANRFNISRDNFGAFSLDIGTVEDVNVNAGDGNDTITVDDLSAAGDLTNVTLSGDGGMDEFVLNDNGLGANVTGNIDGGADNDTLNVSNLTAAETVDLENQSSTSVAGFTSIENFTGDGASDILQASAADDTFDITGVDDGTVSGGVDAVFMDFSILQGLGGNDTFNLNGGQVTGSIDGGTGTNDLNLDNVDNVVNITDANAGNTTGADAGDTTGVAAFSNITDITGGTEADDVTVADVATASLSGTLDGGGGANSLTENNENSTITIDGADSGSSDNINAFSRIGSVNAGAGDDQIVIDSTGPGTLSGNLDGGAGTDGLDYSNFTTPVNVDFEAGTASNITGSVSNVENATGGSAGDTLTGDGNANVLNGGDGNDTIDGNGGPDTMSGGADDDFFIWNNTDGTDMIDGDAGDDSLQVNLDGAADILNISDADGAGVGTRLDITRTTPGVFTLDVDTVENLEVNAGALDDTVTFTNDVSGTSLNTTVINGGEGNDTLDADLANEPVTLNGGNGDDSLTGSAQVDLLDGGAGNDTLDGNGETDVLLGDDGDDLFIWNNGDASEPFEGGSGFDTLIVSGNDGADDELTIGRTGDRVNVSRPDLGPGLGAFLLDIDDVERVNVNGLGGDDTIQVDGLRSTDLQAFQPDGGAPINLDGGDGDDFFDIVPTTVRPITVNGGDDADRLMFQAAGAVNNTLGTIRSENGVTQVTFSELEGAFTRQVLAGASEGNLPNLQVIDPTNGETLTTIDAFTNLVGSIHTGGVRTAIGDINGDGITDIVAAAGPGAGPHVKVFSGVDGSLLQSFFAYDLSHTGGVYVAVGDVDGDGIDDIITGADAGGGPHVKVFSGSTQFFPSELHSFFAYDPIFAGGVRVAAGDITGDGVADIITGAGPSGGPHVKVFDVFNVTPNGSFPTNAVESFFSTDRTFEGGVNVSAGDIDGDGQMVILTGSGLSGGSEAAIFAGSQPIDADGEGTQAQRFSFNAGVTLPLEVSTIDIDSDGIAELVLTVVTENDTIDDTTGSSATRIVSLSDGSSTGLGGLEFDLTASITGGGLTIATPRLNAPTL